MRTPIRPELSEEVAKAFADWAAAHALLDHLRAQAAGSGTAGPSGSAPDAATLADAVRRQQAVCTDLWRVLAGFDLELAEAREASWTAQVRAAPHQPGAPDGHGGTEAVAAAEPPVDILLVDDQADNLTALEAVLQDPALRLVRAASGRDALMALITGEYACVLLDVQMPGMTGLELARLASQRRHGARPPIILLTAHDEEGRHALEGYDCGAVDYVHKPFHPAVLRRKVEIFADLYRSHRQLRLRAVQDQLQEAQRAQDRFLSMLAHELRNPLAPISNAVQVIRSQAAPQPRMDWACEVIARQAGHMARLVDDLLDAARISHGTVRMRPETVALADVLARSVEAVAPRARQRKQDITVELPDAGIAIQADPAHLARALSHVIDNASKFSGQDAAIQVSAACADGQVAISVRDAGAGIAPGLLPHVFELFTQAEQRIDRPLGGLGIGLALARHVVELHGGRVAAHSAGPGQGTEIVVRLPAQAAAADRPRDARVAPIATRPPAAPATTAPVRVLVVDDEVASAETLLVLLELKGFEVRIAHDGPAGLLAAEAFQPHAVLLDIGLPGLDGFEVARRLRLRPHAQDSLMVALTGYGDAETRRRAQQAGFDAHMVKPADMEQLLRLLADPAAGRQAAVRLPDARRGGPCARGAG